MRCPAVKNTTEKNTGKNTKKYWKIPKKSTEKNNRKIPKNRKKKTGKSKKKILEKEKRSDEEFSERNLHLLVLYRTMVLRGLRGSPQLGECVIAR